MARAPRGEDAPAAVDATAPETELPDPARIKRRLRPRRMIAVGLLLAAMGSAALMLANTPGRRPELAPRTGPPLSQVVHWGYQLQNVSDRRIPAAIDLLVVDYSQDGTEEKRFAAETIEKLKTRADGRRRIVLAYLSIGEAERYRYYWRRTWAVVPPRWLGPENRDWRGNYAVKYWDPLWQKHLFNPEPSLLDILLDRVAGFNTPYVDRILDAGFDGLYLDRVDAFGDWEKERATGQADMVDLVSRLARYAKARRTP